MSEYQYVEFQAIDRSLNDRQFEFALRLHALASRWRKSCPAIRKSLFLLWCWSFVQRIEEILSVNSARLPYWRILEISAKRQIDFERFPVASACDELSYLPLTTAREFALATGPLPADLRSP